MTYVVEAGSSRRTRRRRAVITLLMVVLMLFFAFWYAYSYYRSDGAERATPTTCPTATATGTATKAAPPLPSKTIVNVYNATTRTGLAAKTAKEVGKRGFVVDKVANDPLKKTVKISAEVRYGSKGKAKALLVQDLVKGSKVVKDKRSNDSVDLVLGAKFKSVAAAPTGTATTAPDACAP